MLLLLFLNFKQVNLLSGEKLEFWIFRVTLIIVGSELVFKVGIKTLDFSWMLFQLLQR